MSKLNRSWILRRRPHGALRPGDLELVESELEPLKEGEVRIRTVFQSVDPTNRIWISDMDAYMPPVEVGEPVRAYGLGIVVESRHEVFSVGDRVNTGLAHWALYNTQPGDALFGKLPDIPGVPLTAYAGPLGPTGMTAYFGLIELGRPQPGETLVVSAAAGAVGSMVGQIGKIMGCRVVGIAGGADKCRWLIDVAGLDAAIDYKNEDVGDALDRHCPNGIDINFENVGGPIMDAVLGRLNHFARMPLCGLISMYNAEEPVPGPYNFAQLLMKSVTLRGFIGSEFIDRFPEGVQAMTEWLVADRIKYEVDIVEGLENLPAAFERLFTGKNLGKVLVQVSAED